LIWRVLLFLVLMASGAQAERLRLVSTTTTENSGLMDALLPAFEAESGIRVDLLVTGTGQALRIGAQGDADLLLVHDPEGEAAFLAAGFGAERLEVMYNHFLIVGPRDDPAGLKGSATADGVFARLDSSGEVFLSRGDDSGTHRQELRLWAEPPSGAWYRETGAGMGATLNIASALSGYALVDLASWAAFGNRGDLDVMFEDKDALRNTYSLIAIDPARHEHVKSDLAARFIGWMLSDAGQRMIADFRVAGRAVFCPVSDVTLGETDGYCAALEE